VSSTRSQARSERLDPPLPLRLAISWLTNALLLLIVDLLLTGVSASNAGSLLLAAAVFGVLNTVVRPVLRLITLPLAILTLGIAWFFVSMLMLEITNWIVSGFDVDGFWTVVGATLIIWVVNLILDFTPGPWQVAGKRGRRNRRAA
jgi:putative membrane protein